MSWSLWFLSPLSSLSFSFPPQRGQKFVSATHPRAHLHHRGPTLSPPLTPAARLQRSPSPIVSNARRRRSSPTLAVADRLHRSPSLLSSTSPLASIVSTHFDVALALTVRLRHSPSPLVSNAHCRRSSPPLAVAALFDVAARFDRLHSLRRRPLRSLQLRPRRSSPAPEPAASVARLHCSPLTLVSATRPHRLSPPLALTACLRHPNSPPLPLISTAIALFRLRRPKLTATRPPLHLTSDLLGPRRSSPVPEAPRQLRSIAATRCLPPTTYRSYFSIYFFFLSV